MPPSAYTTLVPFVKNWTDEELLLYLLRRGPKCIDPNLEPRCVHGWCDDDRLCTAEQFQSAILQVEKNDCDDFASRVDTAQYTLQRHPINTFITGLIYVKVLDAGDVPAFRRSLAVEMARNHVHEQHRMRMVPPDTIKKWHIDGISTRGQEEYLAHLPVYMRLGKELWHIKQIVSFVELARAHMDRGAVPTM